MKAYTLITILLLLSIGLNAQEKQSITCTTPKRALQQEKDYYKKHKDLIEKNTTRLPGVNTRAYTQSIHNVIVKWDGGSFQSFRIGTAPGLQDIKWGQGLGANARHTGGHSYEELRLIALNNPGGPANFNIGDEFYITMDAGLSSEWVSPPLKFEWENLGTPSNSLTIEVETNYGVNGVGPFADWQRDKMMEFYNLVNPIIKEIYGPPSRNHTVYIVNDGFAVGTNTFYNGPNQISSSYRENGDGDLDQPRLMIHELVHAYRDNVTVSSDREWHYEPTLSGFEEGMAEAVAVIVMDIFIDRYPNFFNGDEFKVHWSHARGMPFDWDYDFQNHDQLTTTDFFSSDIGTGAHWERYGTSQAAMQKIYVEDQEVFKKFNTAYYQQLNANHNLIPSRDLMINVFESVISEVERTPITEWIDNQRILDCKVTPGNKVHMLTFHSVDPPRIHTLDNRIHVIETQNLPEGNEWSWDEIDQANPDNSKRWYIQTNNINGELQIYNYDNTLHQSIGIRNNKRSLDNGVPEYLGPYQGANFLRYNGVFTGNDGRNDCTQPGCGKRPEAIETHDFRATSTTDRNHSDLPNNLPDPNSQIVSGLSELGLYRYEIRFEGNNYTGTYYRLHGDDLVQKDGVIGGIKSNDDTVLVNGKLVLEHENFGEENYVTIQNGAFIGNRDWASVLETEPHRQGGRGDRRYSEPGKVHSIYISEDCSQHKIDFRNIRYGDGLSGSQLFLFNIDDFEDIEFTVADVSACEGDDITLSVSNNFPDILDNDSRVTYRWLDPSGTEIATTVDHTITNASETLHSGEYTLEITLYGCIINREVNVTINNTSFDVTTPDTITICEEDTLTIEGNEVSNATYTWELPDGTTINSRILSIVDITFEDQGTYELTITADDCNGSPITKTKNTIVTVLNKNFDLTNPNEIITCLQDTITLETEEVNGAVYSWTGPNGFTASTRSITINNIALADQGDYTVTVTASECGATDPVSKTKTTQVIVQENDFDVTISGETSICQNETLFIEASLINGATYNWSGPGGFTSNSQQITITNVNLTHQGIYTVNVTAPACNGQMITKTETTDIRIQEDSVLSLTTNDISACEGDSVLLTVNEIENVIYEWIGPNNFAFDEREAIINNVTIEQEGTYIVTASYRNCDGTISIESNQVILTIEELTEIDLSNIPEALEICNNEPIFQEAPYYENASYNWEGPNGFQSNEQALNITNTEESNAGIYTLTLSLPYCGSTIEETHFLNLSVQSCEETVEIPLYFTPNGDGFHDQWLIDPTLISFNYIHIFDRYGKLLKQLTPNNNSWDGNYNGKQMPASEYWYLINYLDNNVERGHFSLIR
ncbi:T9SS type B sorting domain-containing protein [Aquimarina sp. 2201CG5-10]|uniref:T9SS type B sorting domain-containing protein n=1 Tax=Aquimarina callyspongiae TaxID=3098150 RepID=UPI002AB41DC9|nr:T9SS type B sorting domain-containing protein [Aquimarina sp. 2201CG5-10]MDY8138299.1 T9SS type B sorting domain-containing protein [Aquimarina sp. 2201CG5-10]